MATILDRIVETKRGEIAAARARRPLSQVQAAVDKAPPLRDFYAALAAPGPIRLIAEVKKASPSKGIIRADFDPLTIAKTYERHGATCLSVLTDEHYFQGRLDYLTAIRQEVACPLLRKDFILDPYQLYEARAAGADAVLLIAECLNDDELALLHREALALGLTPLVEIYEPANLDRVLAVGAKLIGVNNRDLRTFEVDLDHTLRVAGRVAKDVVLVAESGIRTPEDVAMLAAGGARAILVGETLMRSPDIGAAVDELLSSTR